MYFYIKAKNSKNYQKLQKIINNSIIHGQGSEIMYIHNISKYIMYIIIFEVPDSLLKSFQKIFVEFSKHLQYIFFGEIIITV